MLQQCPECKIPVCSNNSDTLKVIPFRLPYPFIKPYEYPCSIILRPTNGDFLNDYFNSMDLHIGVTTSRGSIVEFDKRGLCKSVGKCEAINQWSQSLLVDSVPEAWYDHWDSVLSEMEETKENTWSSNAYHEETYNCYTFVLEFLRRLEYGSLSETAKNRNKFCEQYIVPRTTAAGKYISLFRKIRDNGFYTHSMKPE